MLIHRFRDGFAEAVLKTLINVGQDIVNGTQDYDIRKLDVGSYQCIKWNHRYRS